MDVETVETSWGAGFALAGLGGLFSVIALLILWVQGFRAGIWWGLLVLFVPLLGVLIFAIGKWRMAKGAFLLHVVASIVGLVGLFGIAKKTGWTPGDMLETIPEESPETLETDPSARIGESFIPFC